MNFNEYNFLSYLKSAYPYLHDIESRVREIQEKTGFGEITINLTVRYKKVEISDIGSFTKTLYKDNKI